MHKLKVYGTKEWHNLTGYATNTNWKVMLSEMVLHTLSPQFSGYVTDIMLC